MNFGISIVLARALDKDVLGIWFALQTLFLVGDSILRYRSEVVMVLRYKSGENPAVVGSQFLIALTTSLVILFLTLTCSSLIFDQIQGLLPVNNPWAVRVALLSLSLSVLATTYIYYLTAQKAFQRYNLLLIGQTLVNLAVVGGAILFGFTTVMSPILGQLAAWGVVLPIAVKTLVSVRQDATWEEIKVLGKEGAHFQFNSFVATLQTQSPRLFALFFLTTEDIGEIGLLFVLVSLMLKYPAAINTVFFTETKDIMKLKLKRLRPVFIKLGSATLLFYLLAVLFSPTVIRLAFGPSYIEIGYLFRSILIFIFLHSVAVVLIGLRNIIGDYRSMNMCISLGTFFQWLYLLTVESSFESVVASYAVFSITFFCLSLYFTRNTIREILY
jgi:O-antigen/teichoic acid export membrane protein